MIAKNSYVIYVLCNTDQFSKYALCVTLLPIAANMTIGRLCVFLCNAVTSSADIIIGRLCVFYVTLLLVQPLLLLEDSIYTVTGVQQI